MGTELRVHFVLGVKSNQVFFLFFFISSKANKFLYCCQLHFSVILKTVVVVFVTLSLTGLVFTILKSL